MQTLYYYGRVADVIIGLAVVLAIAVMLPWCVIFIPSVTYICMPRATSYPMSGSVASPYNHPLMWSAC